MYPPCIEETSQVCFNGCCSSPFSSSAISESHKPHQPEFSITTGASFLNRNTKFTDPESLPSFQTSFLDLITTFPDYLQTDLADRIRSTEYKNLQVFFNHIAHPLFSHSQSQSQSQSHPISETEHKPVPPTTTTSSFLTLSRKSASSRSELLLPTRKDSDFQTKMTKRIMGFMNLEESDYHMILTPDRCSAFKILSELYPFRKNPNLLTVYNYQDEAVESMTGIAEKKGVKPDSAEFSWPSTEIKSEKLQRKITKSKRRGLFVFPLQSLVTGASYSYSWMCLAHEHGWHVLLDTHALGSKDMETLGLSLFNPDFLICSFSDVLGKQSINPSGFGCLFVKKPTSLVLSQPDPLIPTNPNNLTVVTADEPYTVPENDENAPDPENDENAPEFSQEGSLDQKDLNASSSSCCSENIVELEPQIGQNHSNYKRREVEFRALDHADSIGLINFSRREKYLKNWLIRALMSLQHPCSETETPLVRIYGPRTNQSRGPSVSFNVFDWQGRKVEPLLVKRLAEREQIWLECAKLQNVGAGSDKRIRRERVADMKGEILGVGLSVVCVRFGFLTNFEDVFRVWVFVSRFLDADFVEREKWRNRALEKNK